MPLRFLSSLDNFNACHNCEPSTMSAVCASVLDLFYRETLLSRQSSVFSHGVQSA
jgi:hypothetical protein